MKNYILILLLFIILKTHGQNYQPMLIEGNYWIQGYTNMYHQLWPGCYFLGEKLYVDGNANFNGIDYKIIKSIPIDHSGCMTPPYVAANNITPEIAGYMREDINSKKIYTYDSEQNTEFLTYDFSLEVGDYLDVSFYQGFSVDEIQLIQIENITYNNGQILRKFIFDDGGYMFNAYYNYYIEGNGGSEKLIFPFTYVFEEDYSIFEKGNTLSINQIDNIETISIFPNPINQIVNVNFEEFDINSIVSLQIFDLKGVQLYITNDVKFNNQISLENFSNGIYLLQIIDDKGRNYTQKIIKE